MKVDFFSVCEDDFEDNAVVEKYTMEKSQCENEVDTTIEGKDVLIVDIALSSEVTIVY